MLQFFALAERAVLLFIYWPVRANSDDSSKRHYGLRKSERPESCALLDPRVRLAWSESAHYAAYEVDEQKRVKLNTPMVLGSEMSTQCSFQCC